ncbi:MAG: FecR domain-containing protein [Thermoguttaceae bacterium]|jgi:ferric-dicitrate binding protein FerR (iron transport regulator)
MNHECQELLDRYLDGSASAEECRQIDQWIRRDPSAREALFRTAAMEVDLRRLLANPLARPAAEGHVRAAASRRFFAYAAASAAVVAVAGWALALTMAGQYRAKCGQHQAALERLADLEAAGPLSVAPKAPDRRFDAGRLIETRGLVLASLKGQAKAIPVTAESPIPMGGSLWTCPWGGAAMRFADGASMDLERSTEVAISQSETGRHATIKQGILLVNNRNGSPDRAIVIATAHATVKVVNAQVVVASEGDRTLVEVAEGRVEVTRTSDGRTLAVGANNYAVVSPAAEPKVLNGRLAWRLEPVRP